MLSLEVYALALFGFSIPAPIVHDPTPPLGSEETRHHIRSSGLTLEMMNGLPPTRNWYVPVNRVYQPVYYTYPQYPYAGLNAPYSISNPYRINAYPYGLGGYNPPRPGRYVPSVWFFW